MPQTNAKYRQVFIKEFARRVNCIVTWLRIPRTIAQKHAIGIHRQYFGCRRLRRHNRDVTTALSEHAQDIALDAKVVCHDFKFWVGLCAKTLTELPLGFGPFVCGFAGHHFCQILPRHTAKAFCQGFGLFNVIAYQNTTALRAFFAQYTSQRTGVNACNRDDAVRFQIVGQRLFGAKVAHNHG